MNLMFVPRNFIKIWLAFVLIGAASLGVYLAGSIAGATLPLTDVAIGGALTYPPIANYSGSSRVATDPVSLSITLPDARFPIIWIHESIQTSAPCQVTSMFQPVFGKDRPVVNPDHPHVDGQSIRFDRAGEYYAVLNDQFPLKVLVLDPSEQISQIVSRMYEFCVANMVYAQRDEAVFMSATVEEAIRGWFQSTAPLNLLCGETARVFYELIHDRLRLPTRAVTFPGVFLWEGEKYRSSHNVLEVYLPDQRKWALFDINFGFLVEWKDATEIAEYLQQFPSPRGTGYIAHEAFLNLPIHRETPQSFLPLDPVAKSGNQPFNVRELSTVPVQYLWKDAFRFYNSGVAYWGAKTSWHPPGEGTTFLADGYTFAPTRDDKDCIPNVIEYITPFGFKPKVVSMIELRRLLSEGFRREIESHEWDTRIPVTNKIR
jgi:hypothetical protein